ncbi:class I SAM-dependent methyltransferase [Candidatus Solincola tengchongensis]|uniref:class I SAM-dependent methyltransferase n=1 Tax=Candidatus Solincola tengchongensis TaxID=2900693 RepID=UPI0025805600|nr:class I SAM-dependent methyltransferase [Candidatus Solincola tengchongensis]
MSGTWSALLPWKDLLRCPSCGSGLEISPNGAACSGCGAGFGEVNGLPDLLPPDVHPLVASEREHYTEKVDYYLRMHATWCGSPFYRHYHTAFLDDLRRLPPGSLILETGCGLGNDGLELLRSGYRLVETDVSPGQLAEARRLHHGEGFEDASFHLLADATRLPFADASFDGMLMVASLHHLPEPGKALREARRVLRPGGLLVLGTEPNTWQSRTIYPVGKIFLRIIRALAGKGQEPPDTVSEADRLTEGFSAASLSRLLREAGFNRVDLKPAGYLSAALFFASTELSQLLGRTVRLFPLERLAIPLDESLGRLPLLSRYPWHWNAVAS